LLFVVLVCSTTLWVGHLSKLVQQEELSDTFGQYGEIVSIDLIPPRGCAFVCMHRRQDAYRALTKLAGHKLQGKAITVISIHSIGRSFIGRGSHLVHFRLFARENGPAEGDWAPVTPRDWAPSNGRVSPFAW
jgi:RNA recognition motif. (a.k.a. RRM, RBD, or RNP domain)